MARLDGASGNYAAWSTFSVRASKPEYRAGVVSRMRATDEGADMTELIEIRDIERTRCSRNTKARAFARAPELEQARLRVRPIESVERARRENKW